MFRRRGTDPAAAFLHKLTEKQDCSRVEFLVDGYLTFLSRLGLSGRLVYIDRNHIEKWFTPSRFDSTASIRRGSAVGEVFASGLRRLYITIIFTDRIRLSMNERQSRREH